VYFYFVTDQNKDFLSQESIEYFKSVTAKLIGDADILMDCTFCKEKVPAWEALAVAQLYLGVPAHFNCKLDKFLSGIDDGPVSEFDYLEFSKLINDKMKEKTPFDDEFFSGEFVLKELE
jgi:hypothetical protein